jgi:hypothetical protein
MHIGDLKHNTHSDHGIVFKLGPFKTCISQPLWNADFIGPECCEMKVLNGSVFALLKCKNWVYLHILKTNSGFNPHEEYFFCPIVTGMARLSTLLYNTVKKIVHLWNDHRFMKIT